MTAYTSATGLPFATVPYSAGDSLVTRAWSAVASLVVRLELLGNRVVADEDVELPGWVEPTLRRIFELEALPRNWDSYGAMPVDRRHSEAALQFLGFVMADDLEAPDVVPLADGGVQLEWRRGGLDVDFISDDELPMPTLFVARASGDVEAGGLDALHAFYELRDELRRTEDVAA